MTLLWAPGVDERLAELYRMDLPGDAYSRLVKRLLVLDGGASVFEGGYGVVGLPDTGPLNGWASPRAHVMEADPGHVFVVIYRPVEDADAAGVDPEDVLIQELRHGR